MTHGAAVTIHARTSQIAAFAGLALAMVLPLQGHAQSDAPQKNSDVSSAAPPSVDSGNDSNSVLKNLKEIISSGENVPPEPDVTKIESTNEPAIEAGKDAPSLDVIPVAKSPAEPMDQHGRQLEEIVVTATKREESLREIPATIAVMGGESLERSGAQGIEDYLKQVPGVTQLDEGSGARRITIRGVAADTGTNATAGTFIGDVPFNDPYLPRVSPDPNPFDMRDVEVLKGPQGTLFGGSALNGAIRYVPNPAALDVWSVKAYSLYDQVSQGGNGMTYGAAVNVPAGDKLAFRVVGHIRKTPGWVDSTGTNQDDVNKIDQNGMRALMTFVPSEQWHISAMAMQQNTHFADLAFVNNTQGNLERDDTPRASPIRNHYDLELLNIEYAFEKFTFTSETSRTDKKYHAFVDQSSMLVSHNPPPLEAAIDDNHTQSYMQEFRLTSNPGAYDSLQWLAGAAGYRGHMHEQTDLTLTSLQLPVGGDQLQALLPPSVLPGLTGIITEDGSINLLRYIPDVRATELALFGEATKTFWDDLDITLGLRFYKYRSPGTQTASGLVAIIVPTDDPTQITQKIFHREVSEQGVSPKFAVKYRFSDEISLYFSAARGFRYGGIQTTPSLPTASIPSSYKSDSVMSYELGLRTQWMDSTLFVDITPFYIDWKNPQLQQITPDGQFSFIDNVGGAKSEGVEMTSSYLTPIEGLSLTVAASWTNTVTTVPFKSSSGATIAPGTLWPLTPHWQTATTLAYQQPIGPLVAGVSLAHTFTGRAYSDLEKSVPLFDYSSLDLQMSLSSPEWVGHPQLTLNFNNLTDGRATTGVVAGSTSNIFLERPRSLIARFSVEF